MNYLDFKDLQLEKLNKAIEEVRELLNEICSTSEGQSSDFGLSVSMHLDELIVEYLKALNNKQT